MAPPSSLMALAKVVEGRLYYLALDHRHQSWTADPFGAAEFKGFVSACAVARRLAVQHQVTIGVIADYRSSTPVTLRWAHPKAPCGACGIEMPLRRHTHPDEDDPDTADLCEPCHGRVQRLRSA